MIFNDKKWIWNLFAVRYVLLRCLSWLSVRYALIISVCAMFAFLLLLLLLSQEEWEKLNERLLLKCVVWFPSASSSLTQRIQHISEKFAIYFVRWRSMGTRWTCLRGVFLMTSTSGFADSLKGYLWENLLWRKVQEGSQKSVHNFSFFECKSWEEAEKYFSTSIKASVSLHPSKFLAHLKLLRFFIFSAKLKSKQSFKH